MKVEGLRSPCTETGGIVYFARMLDKIRLHAQGALPEEYVPNLGAGFDGRACSFLWIEYPALVAHVKKSAGAADEKILQWVFEQGRKPSDEEIEIWNKFMRKHGWRDDATDRLNLRKRESGFPERDDIVTFFEYIDMDEGRDPRVKA